MLETVLLIWFIGTALGIATIALVCCRSAPRARDDRPESDPSPADRAG